MSKQFCSQRNKMFPVVCPKKLHLVFWINKQEDFPKFKGLHREFRKHVIVECFNLKNRICVSVTQEMLMEMRKHIR